jgi:hypothetical protein
MRSRRSSGLLRTSAVSSASAANVDNDGLRVQAMPRVTLRSRSSAAFPAFKRSYPALPACAFRYSTPACALGAQVCPPS